MIKIEVIKMMMRLLEQDNSLNENINSLIRPLPGQTNQAAAGTGSQPAMGLEECRDQRIRLYWELKGFGRLYVCSH